MKTKIVSIIVILSLFLVTIALAANEQFIAQETNYMLKFKNDVMKLDTPIVTINDKTYMAIRDFFE